MQNVPNLVAVKCTPNRTGVLGRERNCAKGPSEYCYEVTGPHCPRGVCDFKFNCLAKADTNLVLPANSCCRGLTAGTVSGTFRSTFANNIFEMPVSGRVGCLT